MRLTIACVGRAKAAPEQALCDDYLKRARGLGAKLGFAKIDLAVHETSRAAALRERLAEEGAALVSRIEPGAHIIALDEAGKSYDSEAFAAHLARLRDRGADIAFLIGGPDGLLSALRTKNPMAFGAQTWPHLLVRAMLAEQIYRAFAILSRHPYHRGRLG